MWFSGLLTICISFLLTWPLNNYYFLSIIWKTFALDADRKWELWVICPASQWRTIPRFKFLRVCIITEWYVCTYINQVMHVWKQSGWQTVVPEKGDMTQLWFVASLQGCYPSPLPIFLNKLVVFCASFTNQESRKVVIRAEMNDV